MNHRPLSTECKNTYTQPNQGQKYRHQFQSGFNVLVMWVRQFSRDRDHDRGNIDEAEARQLRIKPRGGRGKAVRKPCKFVVCLFIICTEPTLISIQYKLQ